MDEDNGLKRSQISSYEKPCRKLKCTLLSVQRDRTEKAVGKHDFSSTVLSKRHVCENWETIHDGKEGESRMQGKCREDQPAELLRETAVCGRGQLMHLRMSTGCATVAMNCSVIGTLEMMPILARLTHTWNSNTRTIQVGNVEGRERCVHLRRRKYTSFTARRSTAGKPC